MTTTELLQRDAQTLATAMKLRFYPLSIAHASGTRIVDLEGRTRLDFSAGWAVMNVGYRHPHVVARLTEQLKRTNFASLISSLHRPAVELAEQLVALTPGNFDKRVWFGHSGSDASDALSHLLPVATGRRRLISFIGSYHGATSSAMALSGHRALSNALSSANVVKLPYPNSYRCPFGGDGRDSDLRALALLEYLLDTTSPASDTAAIIVEALQSDGGIIVPSQRFLQGVAQLCHQHGIALVLDEVKAGMGRTGRFFAFEHAGITPDVVIIGKALGGGLPLSALVGRAELLDAGFALFTTSGNVMSCVAALATLEVIAREGLVARAAELGDYLQRQLNALHTNHELIGDVRGLGLLQGLELVTDSAPAPQAAAKVVYRAFELGLVTYYVGMHSNVIELTPPLTTNEAEIDEAISILDQALREVAEGEVDDEVVRRYNPW